MASWAEVKGMAGIAEWLYIQSDEERLHMLKFIKYINERGGKAIIPALETTRQRIYHRLKKCLRKC